MLAATDPGIPAGTRTRLIVEPARPVSLSVLPLEDPARAQEVSLESGIPEAVLRRNDAVVRQTHRRAGIVVLDVPEDRQATLRRELEAAGFVARPPKPVYALLNESVPLLAVQPVWRSGVEGGGIRVGIVDTGADRHPDFSERIVSYRDFTETGTVDDVGHGTHVAGIVAGAGPVYRGVAPRASLVIAKALSLHGGTEDTVLAAVAKTARKQSTGQKADAKTLLNDANKAVAVMIKAARADKELDPKTPKNKPFWKSTQLIAKNLKLAKTGLDAKSNDFFKGIAEARKAEEQMTVDWQLTDSKNKTVIENGKKLGHAIALLRTDFSKEAARKKKGGELTAKEKADFEKIKTQQKALLAKIQKLEKAAQKDKALEKGLHEIQKQANHILNEPATALPARSADRTYPWL